MDFRHYQAEAQKTDRVPHKPGEEEHLSAIVPLLGLAGEAGGLLSEYKKFLRDGPGHRLFEERVKEELGDILWYVANLATKFGLDLDAVARENIVKIRDRWEIPRGESPEVLKNCYMFDGGFPAAERFPRQMQVELRVVRKDAREVTQLLVNAKQRGDDLTDNAYVDDGYGFHDVLHFAHLAVLGWSPVLRKLLGCKRKSRPKVDEVEDGGRANAIEEGIAAIEYDYARNHGFLEGIDYVDYEVLRTLRSAAQHLEVKVCSLADWQSAILQGYAVWRPIAKAKGGKFRVDLDARAIEIIT